MTDLLDTSASNQPALDLLAGRLSPGRLSTRLIDRVQMSRDASHYLLRPKAVVTPESADEVATVLRWAVAERLPVTFRSGGSSLSGQASTDGVLVDTRHHFGAVEVLDSGRRVRCQPGAVLRSVNARLAPYGRKLGPDPASETACTIGGVIANNSSGMSSGHTLTAYHTVRSMIMVLPTGTMINSADYDADAQLRGREPELWTGLAKLRDLVSGRDDLRAVIEHQFSMKNTMGYGINALTDATDPVQILAKLMVGSEGTLGFVASAVFDTVPVLSNVATSLLIFDRLGAATDALGPLLEVGARSVELMDAHSLLVAQHDPKATPVMRGLTIDQHTALLVEFGHADAEGLLEVEAAATRVISRLPLSAPAQLSRDAKVRASLWQVRKGLYAAVASARPAGTVALLEDIVVPGPALTPAIGSLQGLLERYEYHDAVIFGHARDANLHFMINPDLSDPRQLDTYARFTDDMVDLVLGHNGSLKAEHGTGRIMAPYVRRQYGDELYAMMQQIKRLCDPAGILNPGVLLDDNPTAHLEHLKITPAVSPSVDRCVECGYCEPVCPSRNLTTTPRRRIVLMREMQLATPAEREELARDFDYQAVQTCAADSLCVTVCPVHIDTGKVMKSLRAEQHPVAAQRVAVTAARHWEGAVNRLRTGLGVANRLPDLLTRGGSSLARRVAGTELVPAFGDDLPGPGPRRLVRNDATPDLIFFPACVGALFAPAGPGLGAARAFARMCDRAGLQIATPEGIAGLCCSTPWESKGLTGGAQTMTEKVRKALSGTDPGLPVVCDAASCTQGLSELTGRQVLDTVTFTAQTILPRLGALPKLGRVVVHPTCSTEHLGATDDLIACAQAVAEEVIVPTGWGCCGFAGDRGMLHPELTASATAGETAEVPDDADGYVSANRTCEWGMSRATGHTYLHVLEQLDQQAALVDTERSSAHR